MARQGLSRGDRIATRILYAMVAWSIGSAIIAMPLMLIEAVVLWLVYGCWILRRYGNCSAEIMQQGQTWLLFLPMILAGLVGAGLVIRLRAWRMADAEEEGVGDTGPLGEG